MRSIVKWKALAALAVMAIVPASHAEILIHDGDKIAFLGDSITAGGAAKPAGYVRLVIMGLQANGIDAGMIPAGVSGHKSNQMLERLDRDVMAKQPQWMTLSCGVNDVWHGPRGVPLDQYRTNITEIVDKAQAAGIKVILLTATPIKEEDNPFNETLAAYNDFLCALAQERSLPLADLNAGIGEALAAGEKTGKIRGKMLTTDGVHMNAFGDVVMAAGVLQAMGLGESELAKAKAVWAEIPGAVPLSVAINVSMAQHQAIEAAAARQGLPVEAFLRDAVLKAAESPVEPDQDSQVHTN